MTEEQQIVSFTSGAIGNSTWNVRRRVGSMLIFEVGDKVEDGRGEFHFWVNCSHWWLQQGKGDDFQDIVNSESNQKRIDSLIKVLESKKFLHVQFNEALGSTIFDFENNLFLRISPYGKDKIREQWYVFTPKSTLSVFSNGKVQIKPKEQK